MRESGEKRHYKISARMRIHDSDHGDKKNHTLPREDITGTVDANGKYLEMLL